MESRNGNAVTARSPKNDIVNIPPEAMEQWDEKVRNGEVQECRVLFVGPGDSGKSSLIRRILKDEPPEYPTMPDGTRTGPEDNTKGIDISYGLTYSIEDEPKLYRMKFMDFGGQTTQTFIHRCFMAPYAVYVLVCALTNENSSYPVETVKEWLRDIKAYDRSGGSPVIVAFNKVDLDTERLLDWETTKNDFTTYSEVLECLRTSALLRDRHADNAVGGLIQAIRKQIPKSVEASRKKVSRNCLNVRRAMESPRADYIYWNEYIHQFPSF